MQIDHNKLALVCLPATAPLTLPDTIFDRVCGSCGERVQISPDGQKVLRDNPEALIICATCLVVLLLDGEPFTALLPSDEQIRNARKAIPNLWRERN